MASWKSTLAIVAASQFVSSLGFSVVAPFLPFHIQQLDSSLPFSTEFLAGLVFSAQAIAMAITSPVWGIVADRYGRKPMLLRATLGGAVTFFAMAFAESAEMLIILRFIQGAFTGVVTASTALVAAMCPKERLGYAIGVLQVGLWSGHGVGPLFGGVLWDIAGINMIFYITSALLVLSGVAVWLGVHESFTRPEITQNSRQAIFGNWRRILSSSKVCLTYSQRFLVSLAMSSIMPVVPLFMIYLIKDAPNMGTLTGVAFGVSSVVSTMGSLFLGRLGDRVGHGKVVFFCSLFGALSLGLTAMVQSFWQLLLVYSAAGFGWGGLIACLAAQLGTGSSSGDEGSVYGLDNSITSMARFLGPMFGSSIAAWLLPPAAFVASAALIFITMLISVFIAKRHPA